MKPQAHDIEFSAQPIAQDASGAASNPAGQPAGVLKPDIVGNIQVRSQDGQTSAPSHPAPAAHDDDEMDKAMQDVTKQMKKDNKKPAKKHFFSKKPKAHSPTQVHAPPQSHPAVQATRPAAKAAAAKPKPEKSLPVMVIFLTVVVTAALIAAAISAYK